MHRVRGLLAHYGPPLVFVAVVYGLLQVICAYWLKVPLRTHAIPTDLALHLLLGLAVLELSRTRTAFVTLMLLLMTLLHVGNALKILILGGPAMPDDALALRSLFLIMERWQLALAVGFLLLLAVAAFRALTLRPRRARVAATALAGVAAVVAVEPTTVAARMDSTFGNIVWDQRANYLNRGPLVHLVQETARYAGRSERAPGRGDVLAAVDLLHPSVQEVALSAHHAGRDDGAAAKPGRNVHVVVLESFWDPSVLTASGLSQDPFVPEFRALWEAGGNSRILAPVFGGYTANSEFEALCGFPVSEDAVFFEARLRNAAPCLPRLFSDAGYSTVASHPNVAVFWNRVNAYDRVGFDVYWSERDFDLDDMNGDFLGDASLYRQVLDKLDPLLETGTPTFNYVLTFFGHLDYPLNGSRPRVISVDNDERLERYVNTVHYKTAEFMDFLARLRERDPDGIVVAFGDHLPFLGGNFESYARSGVLAADRSTFDARMFRDMVATPLIVIDGRNGPVDLGTLPLYQLPSEIRRLAGLQAPAPMDLTAVPDGVGVRPLPGLHLVVSDDGDAILCRDGEDDAPACGPSRSWLEAVATISTDLFAGRQFVLRDGATPDVDGDDGEEVVLAPDAVTPGT
ncbi:LTA synthase family protein [Caenispirillum bisanense]|uniref:LTA synthase family protein n=1 Tax=Caenispirillum bisanense TaxID=414052 RepID=UPI0031DF66B5